MLDADRTPLLASEVDISSDHQHNTSYVDISGVETRSRPETIPGIQASTDHSQENHTSDTYTNVDDVKTTWFVYILSTLASVGGFLLGYDTGVVSGAILLLSKEFSLNSLWVEAFVSVTIATAAVSTLFGGVFNQKYGRKPAIFMSSLVFTVGAVLLGAAKNIQMLIIGRCLVGSGIGFSAVTIPIYIAESAPPQLRGRLITVFVVLITGGQFVASIVDGLFSDVNNGWRYMLGLAGIPSLIQLVGICFMPESPRWLVSQKREAEASDVLRDVRGYHDVSEEVNAIIESVNEAESSTYGTTGIKAGCILLIKIFRTPHVRKALIIGCLTQVFLQTTGINTVMYYTASIIKMSGVKDESTAIWLAVCATSANFFMSFVGLWLVERIGRRKLYISSLFGSLIGLIFIAIAFQLSAKYSPPIVISEVDPDFNTSTRCTIYTTCNACIMDEECGFCYSDKLSASPNGSCLPSQDLEFSLYGRCASDNRRHTVDKSIVWAYDFCPGKFSWLIITAMVIYLTSFAAGVGLVPWAVNAEIYPMWARSAGNAMSTLTNWIFNMLTSMTFLTLSEWLTRSGVYWLYTGLTTIGVTFMFLFLPETKGKTLKEVETIFMKPWFQLR